MLALVYLKTCAQSPLTSELISAGYQVIEAATVPEVVWLCTHFHRRIVLVDWKFEDPELAHLEKAYVMLKLRPDITLEQLIWEIASRISTQAAAS
jgi:hypothetical protein